jgi:hypothetical protein
MKTGNAVHPETQKSCGERSTPTRATTRPSGSSAPAPASGSDPDPFSELEVLASFVHGAVTLGNALGFLYNLKRRQWRWCAIHAAGVALHVRATLQHAKEVRP